MGLPGLTVSTGLVGRVPVGVQIVSGRYREDLCLSAGEAIEAGGKPPMPGDPGCWNNFDPGRGNTMSCVYDFTAKKLAREGVALKRVEGQVLLIFNTAS